MDLHLFDVHSSAGQAPLVADAYLAEPGGKGANVARAIARLGVRVRLVARVGDDEFGSDCVNAISADGVDTSGVAITSKTPTGFVAIELTDGQHSSVLYAPGANDALGWEDVEPHMADLGPDDIVVTQAEVPADTLTALTAHVGRAGSALFLDPTPPDRVPAGLISRAEVITPDRTEAAALVGRRDTSSLWPALAARELLSAGARRVVIKLGAGGAMFAEQERLLAIPTIAVTAVDETGAGDVFLAALAVARLEGLDWPEATRMANVAAALSVSNQGLFLPDRTALARASSSVEEVRPIDPDGQAP